jgi:hypothetical protein
MVSQWECFLKNLGEWQGSFTRMSPQGEEIEDTPTIVTLEGLNDNKNVHQVVRYLSSDSPPRDAVVDYSSLNKSILFFDNGAFSQGSMQWAPYSQFGGEFGLIESSRRLRMVQLYNSSSAFERLVLIREKLPKSNTPERPPLTLNQLLGEWQGEAVTIYPDWHTGDTIATHLQVQQISDNYIEQKLTFGTGTIVSQARVEGSRLLFETGDLPIQILLLPDGASCNCPLSIKLGHNFVLEMGWLLEPNQRQRIIRSYNDKGSWVGCTLVRETKIK